MRYTAICIVCVCVCSSWSQTDLTRFSGRIKEGNLRTRRRTLTRNFNFVKFIRRGGGEILLAAVYRGTAGRLLLYSLCVFSEKSRKMRRREWKKNRVKFLVFLTAKARWAKGVKRAKAESRVVVVCVDINYVRSTSITQIWTMREGWHLISHLWRGPDSNSFSKHRYTRTYARTQAARVRRSRRRMRFVWR